MQASQTAPESKFFPFVSVVVPVYNAERTLQRCLEALVGQDYPAGLYEVLVVDNNSSDRSLEIAGRYSVRLLEEMAVQTSYAARNKGIREAKGEIVAFTDADCVAAPDWLRNLIAPFKDPAIGGTGGQVLDNEPEGEVEEFIASLELFNHYQKDDTFLPVLMTNNSAYRREHLLSLSCFNDHLYTAADIDLAWRLQLKIGAQVVSSPGAFVYHIHRSNLKSMSRQFRRHGFGEVFLDAMYKNQPGYRRTLRRQLGQMLRQCRALAIYLRAIVYWELIGRFRPQNRKNAHRAKLWFVIEGSNLWGKVQGLWATRLLTRNPAAHLWADPGER
jgi:glycosyltransferase involved in cell wall biosynthesis